ncbi:phosphotransferase KptA/Tpt1 [Phakopsora pachyrhizi]|uniref:2'-phosphotransferase n=1 Tax=Phakopsora pachyrhizi TaxID=170000 RepID=A0AAV0AYJ0_PHAPC|nr:phosphotransferase KptA/Tpt1 [Phakopsora pachyrhizi]CAH7675248.1 phosphotransferase KptA/Tpt1 [Phakopsora pachyrhizi]
MRGRPDDSPDVRLSKTLSYILRHGAEKEYLKLRADGFIRLEDVLQRPKLKGFTVDDVRRVVAENDKQRFALLEESHEDGSHVLLIRANQGHTLKVQALELQPITSSEDLPLVIHGTFVKNWPRILLEGLKPMKRNHIHFATGFIGDGNCISGMRHACDIFIYLDIEKCFRDKISFFRSANGVILSAGLESTKGIPPDYFKKVHNKEGKTLFPEEDSEQ